MSTPADPLPSTAAGPRASTRRAARPAAASFRQAYDLLQAHAETLRRQTEPNIDDLLTIVNESVGAYKLCRERIDAVEQALEAALSGAGMDDADAPAARPAARTRGAADRAPAQAGADAAPDRGEDLDGDAAADRAPRRQAGGGAVPGAGASADRDMQDDDIPF